MSENTDVLDFLRAQFARVHDRFDGVDRRLDELTLRIGRLEREAAGARSDIANLHGDWAGMSLRLDGFHIRLERIERRLALVEG